MHHTIPAAVMPRPGVLVRYCAATAKIFFLIYNLIKKYERGNITKEKLQKSIASWTGHAGHADSYNLQKKIVALADAAEQRVTEQKAA